MDRNFTRLITYNDIKENINPDFVSDLSGVDEKKALLLTDSGLSGYAPDNKVVSDLLEKIRSDYKIRLK